MELLHGYVSGTLNSYFFFVHLSSLHPAANGLQFIKTTMGATLVGTAGGQPSIFSVAGIAPPNASVVSGHASLFLHSLPIVIIHQPELAPFSGVRDLKLEPSTNARAGPDLGA